MTPNAAYRHFADRQALLAAVCDAAQAALANAIEDEQSAVVLLTFALDQLATADRARSSCLVGRARPVDVGDRRPRFASSTTSRCAP